MITTNERTIARKALKALRALSREADAAAAFAWDKAGRGKEAAKQRKEICCDGDFRSYLRECISIMAQFKNSKDTVW